MLYRSRFSVGPDIGTDRASHEQIFQRLSTRNHFDDASASTEGSIQRSGNIRISLKFEDEMFSHTVGAETICGEAFC
jgi:hypothetical protein